MSFIKDLIKTIEQELKNLVKTKVEARALELRQYIETFLKENVADMERWGKLVTEGSLTRDEFSWLVKSKRDLLELEFLKLAGYSLVEAEQTRDEVLQLVIKAALSLIL